MLSKAPNPLAEPGTLVAVGYSGWWKLLNEGRPEAAAAAAP